MSQVVLFTQVGQSIFSLVKSLPDLPISVMTNIWVEAEYYAFARPLLMRKTSGTKMKKEKKDSRFLRREMWWQACLTAYNSASPKFTPLRSVNFGRVAQNVACGLSGFRWCY
jgi:hypothetical protein